MIRGTIRCVLVHTIQTALSSARVVVCRAAGWWRKGIGVVASSVHRAPGLTRRDFVKISGAGLALSSIGALALPVRAAPLARTTRAAADTGTLVVGMVAEPTSLDPGQLTDINSMKLLGVLYDTLVCFT